MSSEKNGHGCTRISHGYSGVEDVLLKLKMPKKAGPTRNAGRCLHMSRKDILQADRGELIDGAQVRVEIQAMKDNWRLSKR